MLRSFHKLYAYAKKNKRLEDFWILCGPTENIQALWADVEDGGTESGSGEDGDSNRDANDKVITPTNVLEDDLDPGTSLLWRAETHNFLVGTVRLERRVRVLSEDLTISDVEEPSRKRVKTAEDPWAKYDEIPGNGKGRDELEEVGSVSRKPAEFDGLGHGAFDKTGNDNDDSIMINSAEAGGEHDDDNEDGGGGEHDDIEDDGDGDVDYQDDSEDGVDDVYHGSSIQAQSEGVGRRTRSRTK
ncbi:hypothetical protein HK097_000079 [Rhizophlyctis rosea]|uniref:Uncharacterized protein n=1 Tax=Rhizophlyctis rosea TaxID=64517 RepID=A0AAD5SKK5_9FUNG|nr:hypothetical protein HK097_000079 [Rhizophlyctis rosea]